MIFPLSGSKYTVYVAGRHRQQHYHIPVALLRRAIDLSIYTHKDSHPAYATGYMRAPCRFIKLPPLSVLRCQAQFADRLSVKGEHLEDFHWCSMDNCDTKFLSTSQAVQFMNAVLISLVPLNRSDWFCQGLARSVYRPTSTVK